MLGVIVTAVVGILLVVIGIINYGGNISLLHSYHRSRVAEENIKPFGKMVGIGTIIMGISLIIGGVCLLISLYNPSKVFPIIAYSSMFVGIVVGSIISFYAMIKYNGGIF